MSGHIPVMLAEVLHHLAPRPGESHLDGTFGGGGYARAILDTGATLWALDRDPEAIQRGATLLAQFPGRLTLLHACFGDMLEVMHKHGVTALDGVVLDLGVSSFQLDDAERGFSFRTDGPLDMRMGRDGPSAADLVNTLPEAELADLIWEYGEERFSRRVARNIVAQRPFTTTMALAEVVRKSVPRDPSGIDGATRSFQALRIKVNDELGEIERGLDAALKLLAPGGRLVVVSFHSLEDRIVKRVMNQAAGRAPGLSRHDPSALMGRAAPSPFKLLTQRAERPGDAETRDNPRARSARLRAITRLPASEDKAA